MGITALFASASLGKKIAAWILPALVGGALASVFFLTEAGCGKHTDTSLLDSLKAYESGDSLAKIKQDSLSGVAQSQKETIVMLGQMIAREQKPYIVHRDAVFSGDTAACLGALRECDSLLNLYAYAAAEASRLATSKDIIIGLQGDRLDECRLNVQALTDSLTLWKKPAPKFEFPSVFRFGLDAFAGGGIGTAFLCGARGSATFGRVGIFVEAALLYIDRIFAHIVGGASYTIFGN